MSSSDYEQQILDCWDVTSDIKTLYNAIGEREEPLTQDEIMNTLLGVAQLYELKFERLFRMFESERAERFELVNKVDELTLELQKSK